MYPQVTQFATRERLLREELQLLRERGSAAKQQGRRRTRRRLIWPGARFVPSAMR
jgi:hypothetical protein